MLNPDIVHYVKNYKKAFLTRSTLVDLFTLPDRFKVDKNPKGELTVEWHQPPYEGMLVVVDGTFHAVKSSREVKDLGETSIYEIATEDLKFKDTGKVLAKPDDTFTIAAGDIENYTEAKPTETTLGRFIVNYVLMVNPFGSLIPYMNVTLNGAGKLEKIISNLILAEKINADMMHIYGANILYLSSNPEYFAPTLTKKVLKTGKEVKARKAELLKKYATEIKNMDVVTISKIEKELVDMDKAYCKGDPSKIFLRIGKYFGNIRKKLFVIHGAIPSFGRKGEYDFIPNSLEEGWTENSFPMIANEIRDGTYSRSMEVAKGGTESNFILRVFQDTRITEQDCGTKDYLAINIDPYNYKSYVDRYCFHGGKTIVLTEAILKSYIGKELHLRSPMYCRAKDNGICYHCMDTRFTEMKQDTLAMTLNTVGAMFSTAALKKVHDTAVSSVRLLDIDNYIL